MPALPSAPKKTTQYTDTFTGFVTAKIVDIKPPKAPSFITQTSDKGVVANPVQLEITLGRSTFKLYAQIPFVCDLAALGPDDAIVVPESFMPNDDAETRNKAVERMNAQLGDLVTALGLDRNSFTFSQFLDKTCTVAAGSSFYTQLMKVGAIKAGMDQASKNEVEKKYRSYNTLLQVGYSNNRPVTAEDGLPAKAKSNTKGWPYIGAATHRLTDAFIPVQHLTYVKGKRPFDSRQLPGFDTYKDQLANQNNTLMADSPSTETGSDSW